MDARFAAVEMIQYSDVEHRTHETLHSSPSRVGGVNVVTDVITFSTTL